MLVPKPPTILEGFGVSAVGIFVALRIRYKLGKYIIKFLEKRVKMLT